MIKRVGERTFWGISLALFVFLSGSQSHSKAIAIRRDSNLNFGSAVAGDPAKVVSPGVTENAENASFRITGDKNRAFTIILPGSMTMSRTKSKVTDTIIVANFTSHPSLVGNLGSSGVVNMFVGATRSALRLNQLAGSYSGSFSVTVVY